MERRHVLTQLAGSWLALASASRPVQADVTTPLPKTFEVEINKEFRLDVQSERVSTALYGKRTVVGLGTGILVLDDNNRLKARIKAGLAQYGKIDYWISLAVFDKDRKFLGATNCKVEIEFIASGGVVTLPSELEFDFGVSDSYKSVAQLAVAISVRDAIPHK